MSCIKSGGERCTSCCEVLHIKFPVWKNVRELNLEGNPHKYWVKVSKRRAKKINPFIFDLDRMWDSDDERKAQRRWKTAASYYTCRALVKGVGCSIRDTEDHPMTCKVYKGGYDYSNTCPTDINVFYRG